MILLLLLYDLSEILHQLFLFCFPIHSDGRNISPGDMGLQDELNFPHSTE